MEDPTHISSRQEKQVKKYVKEYFDKAVAKKKEHDKEKAEKKAKDAGSMESPTNPRAETPVKKEEESDDEDLMVMSEDEGDVKMEPKSETPITPLEQSVGGDGLKRKREADDDCNGIKPEYDGGTPSKRPRSITPPAPPPPPPPPMEGMPEDNAMMDDPANYVDESSCDSSYLANGSGLLGGGTELTEVMEDHQQPPPPPPPPQVNDAQTAVDISKYLPNGSFGPSSTPRTDDTADDRGQAMDTLLPERSRYMEAQESM